MDSVFHYTSIENAKNILSGKNLRLYNISSMGDPLDGRLYFSHFEEKIRNRLVELGASKFLESICNDFDVHREFLDFKKLKDISVGNNFSKFLRYLYIVCKNLLNITYLSSENFSTYVSCFAIPDEGDEDWRWKEYGKDHHGIKFHFSRENLLQSRGASFKKNADSVKLLKCQYRDEADIKKYFEGFLIFIEKEYFPVISRDSALIVPEVFISRQVLDFYGTTTKSKNYSGDGECRLVVNNVSFGFDPKIEKNKLGERYYAEYFFDMSALERIVIGRNIDSEKRNDFIKLARDCEYLGPIVGEEEFKI